jgi:succinyl-CoA synthetase beta subunit
MLLIEHDGKQLLQRLGITIPQGSFASLDDAEAAFAGLDWSHPWYLKSQVLQGRRGKSGLVRRVASAAELLGAIASIRELLGSTLCAGLVCDPEAKHVGEWLVSCDIDREQGCLRINYSSEGGMGVAVATSVLIRSEEDWKSIDAPESVKKVMQALHGAMAANDALSMEINPLAILADGSCLALDAKVELDDAAWPRHTEWAEFVSHRLRGVGKTEREQAFNALLDSAGHRGTMGRYVELDGDVAVILSGGGASLLAMDALMRAGIKPSNYLESSGNPDPESLRKAAAIVLSKPGLKALWIAGSFANFTDIQATVMAVLGAMDDTNVRLPVVVRRDGPNADVAQTEAAAWAKERGVTLTFHRGDTDLETSSQTVAQAVRA